MIAQQMRTINNYHLLTAIVSGTSPAPSRLNLRFCGFCQYPGYLEHMELICHRAEQFGRTAAEVDVREAAQERAEDPAGTRGPDEHGKFLQKFPKAARACGPALHPLRVRFDAS
jgi:hypothetical protein